MFIPVMLAKNFEESGSEISYPAFVQPKIDGVRCIAHLKDGKCQLLSRNLKPFLSLPHIVEALEAIFPTGEYQLDGELFATDIPFDELVGLVRSKTQRPGAEKIQFFVFDQVDPSPFEIRYEKLKEIPLRFPLHLVPTVQIESERQVDSFLDQFCQQGYEGLMLRNAGSPYEGKRSRNLQKYKKFLDYEFKILDIEETHFICKGTLGKFRAESAMSLEKMKEYVSQKSDLVNKLLTVKFLGWDENCAPIHPIGVSLRYTDT